MSDRDEESFTHTTITTLTILCALTQSFSLSSLPRLSIATFKMKFTLPLVALSLGTALGAVIPMSGDNTVCAFLSHMLPLNTAC